jgi:hypothetical protein
VHYLPLRAVPAFKFDGLSFYHRSEERYTFDQQFPNTIGIYYAPKRSKHFPTPVTAHYCPECERTLIKKYPRNEWASIIRTELGL